MLLSLPGILTGFSSSFLFGALLTCVAFWTTRVYSLNEFFYALIVMGVSMSGGSATSPANIFAFLLPAASGALVIYRLWIVLISAAFYFVRFDHNVTIPQALLNAGRHPTNVYPVWLRLIITFLIPIAVATTAPLQALRGDLATGQIALYLSVSAAAFLLASRIWYAGFYRRARLLLYNREQAAGHPPFFLAYSKFWRRFSCAFSGSGCWCSPWS